MEDRRTLNLALAPGESRSLLVEAGSLLLVLEGRVAIAQPLGWLAETCLCARRVLGPEDIETLPQGGWVDLTAQSAARLLIVAPEGAAFWSRVGRCLGRFIGQRPDGSATVEEQTGKEA